ncbi:gypsy type transposase [Tanacetum coccineum]
MKITRFFTFKRCGYESVFLFVIAQSWNNVIMYKPIFNQSQIQCGKGKYASGELRNSFVRNIGAAYGNIVDTGGIVPEYIQPESGNQKDDIYAFGVLLLELLTGKKSSYRQKAEKEGFEINIAKTIFTDNTKALAENYEDGIAKKILRRNPTRRQYGIDLDMLFPQVVMKWKAFQLKTDPTKAAYKNYACPRECPFTGCYSLQIAILAYLNIVGLEVHPQLPSSDATMHERPTGKVGMYTRFFDYANYRIPFSNFFVSVLTHFRIPFSQLSVFGSAKNWNDHFFWVDKFVVPANARFGWFSGTNIVKDRAPTISEYNMDHASTLIAQASPFLRELSASIKREFVEDASGNGGGDQEVSSVGGHGNVEPIVPTTDNVVAETEASRPKCLKKKRVTRGSESTPATTHPPMRLRADYGTTGSSAAGGKSPSVLNRLLQDSQLMVEQGVPALPTLPFITSSVTASPLEEGGDHTDSVTGPFLRTVGPSTRFIVLSDSSHHSGAKYTNPEVDSFVRSVAPIMTVATTVTTFVSNAATMTATPVDVGKDKDVPTLSVFAGSSSSDKTDRTLSLFIGRSGSDFVAGSIRAGGAADVDLQEIYIPEWSVTKGFELNDGRSCAKMIDHFTPLAFFKTVR